MSDDKPISIPAFLRWMLDPYVNVMTERAVPLDRPSLETTLLTEDFRPTEKQLQAIGRVTTAWSIMERVIGMAISRLALAPEFPALALTKELTANNRIRVLKILIPLHRQRYRTQIANSNLIAELTTLPAKIQILKDERNIIAHTVWFKKDDDTLLSLRSKPVTDTESEANPATQKSIIEIEKLADDIQAMADHLFVLTQLLPSVDEARHAQLLSQEVGTLHNEILPKRPPPPEASEG